MKVEVKKDVIHRSGVGFDYYLIVDGELIARYDDKAEALAAAETIIKAGSVQETVFSKEV